MYRYVRVIVLGLALVAVAASQSAAVSRVTRHLNVIEFFGGYSTPHGSYDHIGVIDFVDQNNFPTEVDGSTLYDGSFHLGIGFGQLWANHFLPSVKFQFTHIEPSRYTQSIYLDQYGVNPKFNQWDARFALDYQFADLNNSMFTPYVGASFAAGVTSLHGLGFDSHNETDVALSLDFGAEFRIWDAPNGRSFVTFASANSYDLVSSGYRPRMLNLGAALKIYMRP